MAVEVLIKRAEGSQVPVYATAGAAGADLCAHLSAPVTLASLQRMAIPTGLYLEIPSGFEAQVRPRSGLALNQGITCLNSPGTIDSDYRGEIKVILINLSADPQIIEPGQRIAQLVFTPAEQVAFTETDTLTITDRNTGGFGHTGSH